MSKELEKHEMYSYSELDQYMMLCDRFKAGLIGKTQFKVGVGILTKGISEDFLIEPAINYLIRELSKERDEE